MLLTDDVAFSLHRWGDLISVTEVSHKKNAVLISFLVRDFIAGYGKRVQMVLFLVIRRCVPAPLCSLTYSRLKFLYLQQCAVSAFLDITCRGRRSTKLVSKIWRGMV